MKTYEPLILCLVLLLTTSCSKKPTGDAGTEMNVELQLQKLAETITEAEKNDYLRIFLAHYSENAISIPEYQPILAGINEIEAFYKEIFRRQNIQTFKRTIDEIIQVDSTIIEIGTFRKEYTEGKDGLFKQEGKYWIVWNALSDGNLKLKGEAFGFFHSIEKPERLMVQIKDKQPGMSAFYSDLKIPFELKAYNALQEKLVVSRDGAARSEFYTDDAKFMPFQDSTITRIGEIKPYLTEYSSRGEIAFDSIAVYTYHHETFEDHILEYAKFKVRWNVHGYPGKTEGKGIRLWKRQKDKSIKIYPHIGTHDHLQ